ncbi:MAG: hypothetical protein ACOYXA_11110 [Bacteroidota bacterium]
MASTSETGHAKNVATFEDLISFCTGYGAQYNPSKAALKVPALNTLLAACNTALQAVKTAKTAHDNATNAREVTFKPLKPLSTKVINGLSATDATSQTVDDAKSTNLKIQGRRATKVDKPDEAAKAAGVPVAKIASTSQQSYDKLIDHFAQLIATLTAEPKYLPNENELKLPALNALLADLKTKNTATINAYTALSNARIARDKALYGEGNGMVDVAKDVKLYIKSVFGASSPQFKQVSGLKFKKREGD